MQSISNQVEENSMNCNSAESRETAGLGRIALNEMCAIFIRIEEIRNTYIY